MKIINFEERTKPEYDKLSMSQLIIRLAEPWKKKMQKHHVGKLENIIDEGVARRGFFEGSSIQEGEHLTLIKELLHADHGISHLYPERYHFDTQFEKVSAIVDLLGDKVFEPRYLAKRFDHETATTVRTLYHRVKEAQNHTDSRTKEGKRKPLSGTIEGMMGERINNDLLVHRDFQPDNIHEYPPARKSSHEFPLLFTIKYGKSDFSAATKPAEYVANKLTGLQNNMQEVDTHIFDPYMGVAYVLMKGNKCLEKDKLVQKLFDFGRKPENRQLVAEFQEILKNKEMLERREEEKGDTDAGEYIRLRKKASTLKNRLTGIASRNKSVLSRKEEELMMKSLYEKEGAFTDLRGIQAISRYGTKGRPSLKKSKYYKQGTHEVHGGKGAKRVYHAEHAKLMTRMLERKNSRRWHKGKDSKLLEFQKLDLSGLILDLLGPHNKQKYVSTKQKTKYDFDQKQTRFYDRMTERLLKVTTPLDEAVEGLVEHLKTDLDEKKYEEKLHDAAARMYERMYGEQPV
ncbi:MAG: hypothetical protein ACLFO2_03420 [Candidatus Woesearchaeota archaeon]